METIYRLLAYVRDRLKEPSTYPALALILTGIGHYAVPPEMQAALITLGMFVAGMVGAVLPDRFNKNSRASDPEKTLTPVPEKKEPQ